jgi:hypothetical protein
MTSLRTLVAGLIGASVILFIGLLLLTLSLAVSAPFLVFAIAVAAWSIGAYRRMQWAWRAAIGFAYSFAVLIVVGILVLSSRVLMGVSFDTSNLAYIATVAVFAIVAVVATILSFRRSVWHLYEERPQFFSELPSNSTAETDARKSGARGSP